MDLLHALASLDDLVSIPLDAGLQYTHSLPEGITELVKLLLKSRGDFGQAKQVCPALLILYCLAHPHFALKLVHPQLQRLIVLYDLVEASQLGPNVQTL